MVRICRALLLAYHKYISNIASSGFFGLNKSRKRCLPPNRLVIYYAGPHDILETMRWNYRQAR